MFGGSKLKMYVIYICCAICWGSIGYPSQIHTVNTDQCISQRWGQHCPTERKLHAMQAILQYQMSNLIRGLNAEIRNIETRYGNDADWLAKSNEKGRQQISRTQQRLREDRDHMDNETRHLEVALGDIYVVSNYVTPASQSVDISLHNTDDTLRRIKTKLLDMEYRCEDKKAYLRRQSAAIQSNCRIPVLTGLNCAEIQSKGGRNSGPYFIKPMRARKPIQVRCDMEDAGGGWTVIQRRFDGSLDFDRDWNSYKHGFGQNICQDDGEYWLGNEYIHMMTNENTTQLKIDLTSWDEEVRYAWYSFFRVANEQQQYALAHCDAYRRDSHSVDIQNAFKGSVRCASQERVGLNQGHIQMPFTTNDVDNDNHAGNCAAHERGGWWYNGCASVNLNGKRHERDTEAQIVDGDTDGMVWVTWKGCFETLKASQMKIRPFGFNPDMSELTASFEAGRRLLTDVRTRKYHQHTDALRRLRLRQRG